MGNDDLVQLLPSPCCESEKIRMTMSISIVEGWVKRFEQVLYVLRMSTGELRAGVTD